MGASLWSGTPGRLWFEFSLADQGLGYSGSYATLGGKYRLFDDFLDGRWLFEGQGHVNVESGGFFSNLGIERVFSLQTAGADLVLGGWFDYDSDQQGDFGHTFTQFAVNAAIKTRQWDVVGNGYFPVGSTDYSEGDPTGVNCFFRNSIVLQAGIDSALQGFDALFRYKPTSLAIVNGTLELGGYQYGSDLVDSFGGVRGRVGMQLLRGMTVVAELNHDNRFDFTGVLQMGWQFGVSANGNEYAGLGRDLEPTIRQDHIVRFHQDTILAIDPDTGRPYNVFHVDNTADPAFGNGTNETRFTTLLDAQNASGADDIIFVHEGDGTTRGMNRGIVLKDGQLLLGDGVQHIIPIQNGQNFVLCNNLDGNRPKITNTGGQPVVTLADRNTVRGFEILANGTASNGIQGNAFPAGPPITDGIIEDNLITNAILHGISLDTIAGDWRFARNTITGNGFDGINIVDACDPASTFVFEDNVVSNNGRDGIHMENFDGASFTFTRNVTNGNVRDGVRLIDYKNLSGLGGEFVFASPISQNNNGDGIHLENIDGNVRILNPNVQNNVGDGIELTNVTNTTAGDATLIGTSTGGTSTITGNGVGGGAGVKVQLTAPGARQILTVTNTNLNNNGIGILANASGSGTHLTTNVIDNLSVSNTVSSGMRFSVVQGALHEVVVQNSAFTPLTMASNGTTAGNGIEFLVGDNSPGLLSRMDATVSNVNISNTGTSGAHNSMLINVQQDGQLELFAQNINMTAPAGNGILATVNTNAISQVSQLVFDNVNITTPAGNGIGLSVFSDSWVDFQYTNGTITGGGGRGMDIAVSGNANTLFRSFVQNATVTNFVFDGIALATTGSTRSLVTFDGNNVSNNGPGLDPANLPYFDGFDISVGQNSTLNARFLNNAIIDNFERSIDLRTTGNGVANILMVGNTMGSDFGEDAPPAITSNLDDMDIVNGPAGQICLAMSNNTFQWPAFVTNNGGGPAFVLELDGLTNGVGVPVITGAVTLAPFGSNCQPAIQAEETFFILSGFDPTP